MWPGGWHSMSDTRWMRLALDQWLLAVDVSTVVWLRMGRLMVGDAAAATEAERMIAEKVEAAMSWQALALSGGLGTTGYSAARKTTSHYGKTVRANRRRLSKS